MSRLFGGVSVSQNEQAFAVAGFADGVRVDGRSLTQLRRLGIEYTGQTGCCEVTLGRTRVLARINCRVVEPSPYRAKDGFLDFQVVLSPMADPEFLHMPRRASEVEEIRRILERVLKTSKAVDVESLCILPGRKVWSLRCEVTVVDSDGNLVDACAIATLAALMHFRRPEVTIRGEDITIHEASDREPIALNMSHTPIIVTFAICEGKGAHHLVIDPTLVEQSVATGEVSVAVNTQRQICIVHKVGGASILPQDVVKCVQVACAKVDYIIDRVTTEIAEDAVLRKKELEKEFEWAKERTGVGKEAAPAKGGAGGDARRKRAKGRQAMRPDDADGDDAGADAAAVKGRKRIAPKVNLTSRAKFTLNPRDDVPRKGAAAAADEDMEEEVEEIEEIEEVEEVEEEEEEADDGGAAPPPGKKARQ